MEQTENIVNISTGGAFGTNSLTTNAPNFNYVAGHATWFVNGYANFNASRSNSIYGKSTTVTPLSCKTGWYIKYQ